MSMAELRALCVDHASFAKSTRRRMLMGEFEKVCQHLISCGVPGELWVDGSYVTEKIDPDDLDVVLRTSGEFYDAADTSTRDAIEQAHSILADPDLCHFFPHWEYLPTSPFHAIGVYQNAYWLKQWGFGRQHAYKGIAVIQLPGGAL